MLKIPRNILEKVFDIREGELRRAVSMQFNIFLIITTLLILKPTINALFLSNYGIEQLPIAFVLVALFAGILTSLYAKIAEHVRFQFIHQGTLVSSFLFLIFFGTALYYQLFVEWLLYAFYIWLSIFALLTTSQFWLLANQVFHERELKRLVGFIGAGAIAGGIFGGFLTSVLIKYMTSEYLPFVAALIILLLIPLNWYIRNSTDLKMTGFSAAANKRPKKDNPLQLILQSNHLKYLAAIVAISVIVAKFVDYQFSAVASAIILDKDELTSFFGIWYSTFNVVSLLLQLLVTRILLNRFGVGGALMILPLLVVGISFALLFGPEILSLVILLKMADGSLKQSINRSGMELLILPIDLDIKNKTKPFIDVFVDSVATGLSGILLLFIINSFDYSGFIISGIILLLGAIWTLLVLRIKKEYLHSFKNKIARQLPTNRLSRIFSQKMGIIDGIQEALNSDDPHEVIRALQSIRTVKMKRLVPTVRSLLDHPYAEVRWEAIQFLQAYRDEDSFQLVQKMTNDPDRRVQLAAFAYMIERTPQKNISNIERHLDSENSRLSGLALVSLASFLRKNPKMQRKYAFDKRLKNRIAKAREEQNLRQKHLGKIYSIKAISNARLEKYYPILLSFFKDPSKTVARQAIYAAGKTRSLYFVEQFLLLSTNQSLGRSAKKALAHYGPDSFYTINQLIDRSEDIKAIHLRSVPDLIKTYHNHRLSRHLLCKLANLRDPVLRNKALKTLTYLRPKLSRRFFKSSTYYGLLEAFVFDYKNVRNSALVIRNTIRSKDTEIKAASQRLSTLLQQYRAKRLEHIFILLSLRYDKEDMFTILNGLRSRKKLVKSTAIEYLDNLLSRKAKQILIPMLEESTAVGKIDINEEETKFELPSNNILINLLENTDTLRMQQAILYYMYKVDRTGYHKVLLNYSNHPDPEIKALIDVMQLNSKQAIVKNIAKRS